MSDMSFYIGGEVMPKFSELTEIVMPNAREIITLDGSLQVDFINVRRGWKIKYKLITASDYQLLRDKFDDQFTNQSFFYVNIPAYNIYAKVYIKINDKNIKYNGTLIEDCELVLYEQYAIS